MEGIVPLYDYQCSKCVFYTEIKQNMRDDPIKKCPNCGKNSLERIIISPPSVFVRGDPHTIGQLADRNAKKMGHYELEERKQKDNVGQSKEKSETRKLHRKINSMSKSEQLKWIRRGD